MGTLRVVRLATAVVLGAVLTAAGFRVFAPPTVVAPLAVAALAVPSVVLLGEGAIAIGAADVGDGVSAGGHLVLCQVAGSCRAVSPSPLSGGGTWHGYAGTLPGDDVGDLEVAWALGIDIGLDGRRTVALVRTTSEVRAATGGSDATP